MIDLIVQLLWVLIAVSLIGFVTGYLVSRLDEKS
jgi:hypothetical protein